MNGIDKIYRETSTVSGSFKFDDRVASVFDDMISRSVPGYRQILHLLPTLTRQFKFNDHQYYDLGCSLGAGLLAMAEGLGDTPATLIGIDNSAAMIKQARANLMMVDNKACSMVEQDILDTQIRQAGMVLMNFTLQFIPLEQRARLITNIYHGLCNGGALILSEKIAFNDSNTDRVLTDIHHQFKADQGYSDMEIARKRDAIENVLIPETMETHVQRLTKAGFSVVTPWIQNLQFVSILAVKQ